MRAGGAAAADAAIWPGDAARMADESVCSENVGGPPLSCSAGVEMRPVLEALCDGWLASPVVAAPVGTLPARGVAFVAADAGALLGGLAPFPDVVALAVLAAPAASVAPPNAAPGAPVVADELDAAFSALTVSGLYGRTARS